MAVETGRSTVWNRVFATLYDPFVWWGERSTLRALRAGLLGRAAGRTVEVGGGTGLNLRYYPDDLDELVVTEPDAAMRARLSRRLNRPGQRVSVVGAPAEELPFDDATVDTIVSTLVLCTVDEPADALREFIRVLRPGGRLLFLEHVRSDSPRLARRQDRVEKPWRRFAAGCRCNRATVDAIKESGLELESLKSDSWRGMPSFMRPLAVGMAVKGAVDVTEAVKVTGAVEVKEAEA